MLLFCDSFDLIISQSLKIDISTAQGHDHSDALVL